MNVSKEKLQELFVAARIALDNLMLMAQQTEAAVESYNSVGKYLVALEAEIASGNAWFDSWLSSRVTGIPSIDELARKPKEVDEASEVMMKMIRSISGKAEKELAEKLKPEVRLSSVSVTYPDDEKDIAGVLELSRVSPRILAELNASGFLTKKKGLVGGKEVDAFAVASPDEIFANKDKIFSILGTEAVDVAKLILQQIVVGLGKAGGAE